MKRKLFALKGKKTKETGIEIENKWGTIELDYEGIYLQPVKSVGKHPVYISCKNYQILSNIISQFAIQELTVGMYIGNILKQHFFKYKDDIKNLLGQYSKNVDPFDLSEAMGDECSVQYGDFLINSRKFRQTKSTVNVDTDTHSKSVWIINTISSKNFSIGSYIDDILERHFTEYKEEIRTRCSQVNIRKASFFD